MQMSRRAYARRHGVTEGAIRYAISQGFVVITAAGQVDVERSDAVWGNMHAGRASYVRTVSAPGLDADVPLDDDEIQELLAEIPKLAD